MKITFKEWCGVKDHYLPKHDRAGRLMMRRNIKERVKRKWMNAYVRYLDMIPNPDKCVSDLPSLF